MSDNIIFKKCQQACPTLEANCTFDELEEVDISTVEEFSGTADDINLNGTVEKATNEATTSEETEDFSGSVNNKISKNILLLGI